jgi:hypothetical protein
LINIIRYLRYFVNILAENIGEIQAFGKKKFSPPNDVKFIVGNLNDDNRNPPTVIDYDVAVVHIHPSQHSMGYFSNLPKVAEDTSSVVSGRRAPSSFRSTPPHTIIL